MKKMLKADPVANCRGTGTVLALLLIILLSLTAEKAIGQSPKNGLSPQAYLPTVMLPPAFPQPPESSVEGVLKITPTGGINASTFNSGAFIIENNSESTARINQITIDLRTAAFPDMVFDPFGTAGDLIAKDVTIDTSPTLVGFTGHTYSSPHDSGFDVLVLNFNNFDPGEQVAFSVDVDPTSIRGVAAPGPADSGSVSGLELSGAAVTVNFSNNLSLVGKTLPIAGSSSGSIALIRQNLPNTPTVSIENVPNPPTAVSSANQVVLVSGGPDWSTAVVKVIEGGLFTTGLPGGGFDIDPFEANSALQVNEFRWPVDNRNGQAAVPINLTRAHTDGGLNHILVYFEDFHGFSGPSAATIVLELTP
jgi:hypothetical protein